MSLSLCNRQISPLQRRSMQIFGANLALVAMIEISSIDLAKQNPSWAVVSLFALLSAIPVVAMIVAVGRYLARETDEFIRSLVVSSILWSFGVIVVVDTILGVLLRTSPGLRILPMLNIDLFCIVAPLALRMRLWSNR